MESRLHVQPKRISTFIKIAFGFIDQGCFSIANYAASIYLARLVTPDDYGVYSISFSALLFISLAQSVFFGEPISVFGAREYRDNLKNYLNSMYWSQVLLSGIISIVILLVLVFLPPSTLKKSLILMMVSLPFIFSFWFLRRAYYIQTQANLAAISSVVYAALLFLALLGIGSLNKLNSATIYLAMGGASFLASIFSFSKLSINFRGLQSILIKDSPVLKYLGESFSYGKWLLIGLISSWVAVNAYPIVISQLIGTEQAGAYRAIQNIFLPMQQTIAAITLLSIPWLSKQAEKGARRLKKLIYSLAMGALALSSLYGILAWIFKEPLLDFLYNNKFYASFDILIPAFAFQMTALALATVLSYYLRIFDKQKKVMWSKILSAVFFILFGIYLIFSLGIAGIIITLIVSAIIESLFLIIAIAQDSP